MKQKGFTLIELLVVIAIIQMLAAIAVVSFNVYKLNARNLRRITNFRQVYLALELYYDDNNKYPSTNSALRSQCQGWGGYPQDQVIPGLIPTYMNKLPSDPTMNPNPPDNGQACYIYRSNGTDYMLIDYNIAPTEISKFTYQTFPQLIDPTRDGGLNPCEIDGQTITAWKVSSPGGRCW